LFVILFTILLSKSFSARLAAATILCSSAFHEINLLPLRNLIFYLSVFDRYLSH
jgi:hypothetical protein